MPDKEKIVMKTNRLDGVDMSVNNLEMFTSVRIRWTVVSHLMTKKHKIAYIGTKEQLLPGDIIQVGNLGFKYKVVSLKKLEAKPQGYIYRIKRVDNNPIASIDIDNILIGQKVQIVSNKTFQQIFEQHPDVPHVEICPIEIPDTEFSCLPRPVQPSTTPNTCHNYLITFPLDVSGTIHYKDCEGLPVEEVGIARETDFTIVRCGIPGQTSNDIYFTEGETVINVAFSETEQQCPTTCEDSIQISAITCGGVPIELEIPASPGVYGAALYYPFDYNGVTYEVYNQPLDDDFVTPELGVWYLYSYATNTDIAFLNSTSFCPTGVFTFFEGECEGFSSFTVNQ